MPKRKFTSSPVRDTKGSKILKVGHMTLLIKGQFIRRRLVLLAVTMKYQYIFATGITSITVPAECHFIDYSQGVSIREGGGE